MSVRLFNIHGLVQVSLDSRCDFLDPILSQLREFQVGVSQEARCKIFILPYSQYEPSGRSEICFDYMRCGESEVHDPHRRFAYTINKEELNFSFFMDELLLPINMIVQLALLEIDHSFVHASSVTHDKGTEVFTAFAGVGKTTLVMESLKLGFTINGDDLVIVGQGKIFPYPQDLSVYGYHRHILALLPGLVGIRLSISDFVHRILEWLPRRFLPFKLIRVIASRIFPLSANVPSRVAFGSKVGRDAVSPTNVYFVARTELHEDFRLSFADPDTMRLMAHRNAHILLAEWHAYFYDLLLLGSLSPSSGLDTLVTKIVSIYNSSFSNSAGFVLTLSTSAKEEVVSGALSQILQRK